MLMISSIVAPAVLSLCLICTPAFGITYTVGEGGDFPTDGTCDEVEINKAIQALPTFGGVVSILGGTYEICAEEASYGGIIINKSNVTLKGEGPSTLLRLADEQNTNVIRVVGSVKNIVIEKLRIDGNRSNNSACGRVYNGSIPHDGFECNGIKAHYLTPIDYVKGQWDVYDRQIERVWVRDVIAENANGLNIMLSGRYVYVFDSYAGDARSDSIELLIGPGQINRTTVVVSNETGYALSTDGADDVQVNENLVHVLHSGSIYQSILRTWAGNARNQINNNMIRVEDGGTFGAVTEINTTDSQMVGNLISASGAEAPLSKPAPSGTLLANNSLNFQPGPVPQPFPTDPRIQAMHDDRMRAQFLAPPPAAASPPIH